MREINRLAGGATHLGFLDILTAAILLGVLLWAASLQFPAYERTSSPAQPVAAASH
jgi:hypothetical protein